MSYILNALRKSEQERQAKQVQTIENSILDATEPANTRSNWPVIIAVLIVINLITLTYLISNGDPETTEKIAVQSQKNEIKIKPEHPKKSVVLPQHITPGKMASATPAVKADPVKSKPKPLPPIRAVDNQAKPIMPKAEISKPAIATKTKAADLPATTEPKKPQSAKITTAENTVKATTKIQSEKKPAKSVAVKTTRRPAIQTKAEVKTPPIKNKPEPLTTTSKNIPAPTQKKLVAVEPPEQKAPSKTKPAEKEYPLLKELPYDFRRNVPKLNINVFVYSEDPAQCFVIIDMLKYQAGELLPGSITLKEIRNDSLLVSYKNRTFRIKRP